MGVEEQFIKGTNNGAAFLEQNGQMGMGHSQTTLPNIPRPPNPERNTSTFNSKVQDHVHDLGVEKEEFMDAS
ncbi:hypothetical protein A2U01_0081754, partial [Trifolium medium]|nr:hypothetical protein [Trifolium medium]